MTNYKLNYTNEDIENMSLMEINNLTAVQKKGIRSIYSQERLKARKVEAMQDDKEFNKFMQEFQLGQEDRDAYLDSFHSATPAIRNDYYVVYRNTNTIFQDIRNIGGLVDSNISQADFEELTMLAGERIYETGGYCEEHLGLLPKALMHELMEGNMRIGEVFEIQRGFQELHDLLSEELVKLREIEKSRAKKELNSDIEHSQ